MTDPRTTESVKHRIEWRTTDNSRWLTFHTRCESLEEFKSFIARLRKEPVNKNMEFRLQEVHNVCTVTTLEV